MGTSRAKLSYPLDLVALAAAAGAPLHRQLADQLRGLILDGAVGSGARLPSIRGCAAELGVSRNTVIAAFDQLAAEGLIESRGGSGTRVAAVAAGVPRRSAAPGGTAVLSERGRAMASQPRVRTVAGHTAFHPGTPELAEFPFKTWSRLLSRRARFGGADIFGYHHIAGHPALREAIASFLTAMRKVECTPAQVVVTTGGQAALDLLARLLLDPGDPVWMEEPGYLGARGALIAAGARLWPLPVTREGWQLAGGVRPAPRLIYLTPSCQHPLGVTMPLDARLAILELAREAGAWVIEDDFDGEYTFRGPPVPAMQGLGDPGRVIYVGTFAKTLFPAMRLGFMVLPADLAERCRAALSVTGQFAPLVLQAVLADFIAEGYFFRHLNRMRRLYGRRRAVFLGLFREALDPWLEPVDGRAGIQVAATFRQPVDDLAVAARLAAADVNVAPLSLYFLGEPAPSGLLMGYANLGEAEMRRGFGLLRGMLAAGG